MPCRSDRRGGGKRPEWALPAGGFSDLSVARTEHVEIVGQLSGGGKCARKFKTTTGLSGEFAAGRATVRDCSVVLSRGLYQSYSGMIEEIGADS